MKLNGEVESWRVCIFEFSKEEALYKVIYQSEPLSTEIFRVYNFGLLFGYASLQEGSEKIHFINEEKINLREIDGAPFWPERVFVSYCESFQIFAYEGYFIIYKVEESGNLSYFRSVQETVRIKLYRYMRVLFGKSFSSSPPDNPSFSCRWQQATLF